MAMNIKNPQAYRLAQELAKLMGTSLTDAIIQALREKWGKNRVALGALGSDGTNRA